jgi:hypothetical protein
MKCISDCDQLIAVTNTFRIVSDALAVAICREHPKMGEAGSCYLDDTSFLGKQKALCGIHP